MIQRIQTVYLALAVISLGLMLFMPICWFELADTCYTLDIKNLLGSDGSLESAKSSTALIILLPVTMLVVVIMLLQYKNRQRQLAIGRFSYLLIAGLIAAAMFFIEANKSEGMKIAMYGWGYCAPVAALPFIFLANRSIKKDEELVKSLDRLR